MIQLQGNDVIYNNSVNLGLVQDMNYVECGFSITLLDGSMVFIPEQDCTFNEQEAFDAYHEFYEATSGVKPLSPPNIGVVRAAVIEAINQECAKRILSGFISKAFDGITEKHYDCEFTDQLRIPGLVNIAQLRLAGLSSEIIKWKASGELECYEWTPEQMVILGLDLKKHIESHTDIFYAIRIYVLDPIRTNEELEAITWELVIP